MGTSGNKKGFRHKALGEKAMYFSKALRELGFEYKPSKGFVKELGDRERMHVQFVTKEIHFDLHLDYHSENRHNQYSHNCQRVKDMLKEIERKMTFLAGKKRVSK